jgi:hypothetical protein
MTETMPDAEFDKLCFDLAKQLTAGQARTLAVYLADAKERPRNYRVKLQTLAWTEVEVMAATPDEAERTALAWANEQPTENLNEIDFDEWLVQDESTIVDPATGAEIDG